MSDLSAAFGVLTGHPPNLWQRRLYEGWFARGFAPDVLDLPTGLGKTAVMALWLIGRANGAALPRRLVYVVDRRAVVDQATELAERLARFAPAALPDQPPPTVSTLRGRHADNRRWLEDPAAPAIIVGTIDMIGSRLLFEGYGVSRGMRPFQAGLLGADSLFVLDEAHLCPPFEALLAAVSRDTARSATGDAAALPPPRLLSLSATGRSSGERDSAVFQLEEADCDDWTAQRLDAAKQLTLLDASGKTLALSLAAAARNRLAQAPGARLLVFAHSRADALKIADDLGAKDAPPIQLLTGERRVHERDQLAESLAALGFLNGADTQPSSGPAVLVATAAGEVGIDLDADHMVCDLVTVERMIQRLGRVNRSGGPGRIARVTVIVPPDLDADTRARLEAPLRALPPLPQGGPEDGPDGSRDASPGALVALRRDAAGLVRAATEQAPLHPPLDRATVEGWAMTALDDLPGRPAPAPWLRGWVKDEEPTATLLWRRHLPWHRRDGRGKAPTAAELEAFFAAAPPHLREGLEAPLEHIRRCLAARLKAARLPVDAPALVALSPARAVKGVWSVGELAAGIDRLWRRSGNGAGDLLVASAALGGLSASGHLDEKADADALPGTLDGGWDETVLAAIGYCVTGPEEDAPGEGWKLAHRFALPGTPDEDETEAPALSVWTLRRPGAAGRRGDPAIARRSQSLADHHGWTEAEARRLADALWNAAPTADRERWTRILTTAARLHDLGKDRALWQAAMAAPRPGRPFAKTEGGGNLRLLAGYRHEFGSLGDAGALLDLPDGEERDLVLHLIAAHHGHARPSIPPIDPDRPPSANAALAAEAALRFARLQRRLGPWALAGWEALLRAADQRASRRLDDGHDGKGHDGEGA
ncbi:type I-U CRISPR-associated helicase/endonuclease Cas3 [Azospirillum argentinense]|uniref:Type I-U CRISPR-associated helicase/endonuclease Cas3 n=1 Tax=Azospirillum argentinense TaxID=2970906 RepID=A0ABW8VF10_9PROT